MAAATIAPAELVRVASSFGGGADGGRARAERAARLGVPAAYAAVSLLALAVAVTGRFTPGYLTAWRAGTPWVAAALGAGCALVGAEFAVGALPKARHGIKGLRISVATAGASGFGYLLSIGVTAVAEELLYRGLWIGTLHERLHMPTGAAIGCAAVAYALGHLFFGVTAVAQKTVSGVVFGLLLTASGSLTVAIAAHLAQNLTVFTLAARQAPAR